MGIVRRVILGASFLSSIVLVASAQAPVVGKLDVWTTKRVEQNHESTESTYIRAVRAAKQNGFDRVVFEFKGPLPNYSLEYLRSRWYEDEGGRRRLKLAGSAFLKVDLHIIPVDEEQLKLSQAKDFYPKSRLKFPSLTGVEEGTFFEGYYDFFLGVKARKPFRVTELANPARLVIDFKH
ncbi:MAG TPA: hypothetical protein VLL54_20135 [Pyrinomonadaceae bacterium]|nr:hypothetical protein [Pyrinomonadaceae bacterium]